MFTKRLDNRPIIPQYLINMHNKHGGHKYQLFQQTENIDEYRHTHTPRHLTAKRDNKVN